MISVIRIIGVFLICCILNGCQQPPSFQVELQTSTSTNDTLFIRELHTGRVLARVSMNKSGATPDFPLTETTLAEITRSAIAESYLTIISPGIIKIISADSTRILTKNSVPDSMVNYLWQSNNQVLSKYSNIIFGSNTPNQVLTLFDSLMQTRAERISSFKSKLSKEEYGLLQYQNKARVYSFLMYYGRMIKRYPPDHEFFNFIDKIDNEDPYSKSLPDNILYKYEIQLLRERDSIHDINSFLSFIESQTKTKDLQSFLKAIYLKNVIEYPSYWRKHEKLFTTDALKEALQREQTNPYSYLIHQASESLFASQQGVQAFDFTAQQPDGSVIHLSDLKGKLVIIDAWATWCGPCVDQRPHLIELAKKYKDNPNVVFLMVSVDKNIDRWKRSIARTNPYPYGIDVNIPDGMNSEFGDRFLVKAIPKYVLIDRNGVIINSNLPEPSQVMEEVIERAGQN